MFIGIDLGTSAVKLLAMSNEGKILKTVQERQTIHLKEGDRLFILGGD